MKAAKIFEKIKAADITNHFVENNFFSYAQHGIIIGISAVSKKLDNQF